MNNTHPSDSQNSGTTSMVMTDSRKNTRNYMVFWTGQKISLLGSEIVQYAITWALTIRFQDPTILSLGLFLTLIPRVIFGPLAGVLTDRYSYKKLLVLFDSLQAVTTLGLFIMMLLQFDQAWVFLTFNTFRAIFQTFHSPVVSTMMPFMIPKDKLARYQGVNQLSSSLIMMVGPIVSAFLLNILRLMDLLWIDIGTFVIAVIFLMFTKIPPNSTKFREDENIETVEGQGDVNNQEPRKKDGVLSEFKEGLYVFRDIKGLSAIFFIGIFGTFCLSPFNTLLTYFVNVVHGGGIREMTIVTVFIQVSLVLGSLVVILKKNWKRRTLMMILMVMLLFLGNIVMALSPEGNFVIINIGIAISFIGLPAFSSIFMAIMESVVPIEKMGRFSAFRDGLISIVMPLGILISGPLSKIISVQMLLIIAAGLGIAVSIITYFTSNVRSLDTIQSSEK